MNGGGGLAPRLRDDTRLGGDDSPVVASSSSYTTFWKEGGLMVCRLGVNDSGLRSPALPPSGYPPLPCAYSDLLACRRLFVLVYHLWEEGGLRPLHRRTTPFFVAKRGGIQSPAFLKLTNTDPFAACFIVTGDATPYTTFWEGGGVRGVADWGLMFRGRPPP